jgi:phosphoglycerate dehydrogenase-like enzyme
MESKMKALLLAEWGKPFYPRLRKRFPGVDFVEAYEPGDTQRQIADAEVVFGYPTAGQFQQAKRLKWIQTLDAGMEGFLSRVPAVVESPVVVTNAQGAGGPQIGEHAVALMLAFSRGLVHFMRLKSERRWDQKLGLSVVQMVQGRTVGIVGLGKSGMEVAWRCKALGMHVLAVDKHDVNGEPVVEDVWSVDRLGDLLEQSDYVVVTAPYTRQNENMIGAAELARMKPTAYLIVTSRGRVVEHNALVDALRRRRIAGAGLDVVVKEPLPADNELWGLDNVIITPHIAGNSPELDERTYNIFEENMHRYLAGEPLRNTVDKVLGY